MHLMSKVKQEIINPVQRWSESINGLAQSALNDYEDDGIALLNYDDCLLPQLLTLARKSDRLTYLSPSHKV